MSDTASTTRGAADRLRRTASGVFGWDVLRPGQLKAMEAVVEGRDTLVVMPTGAGKSAVYQVAALCLPGPTAVVSPLLALQRDQIAGLLRHDGPEGVAVNSDQGARQTAAAWEAVRGGDIEYLFLSPEQLAKDDVVKRLAEVAPSLFVVDEAQCVSTWGHDFRPAYLRLAQVVERVGRPTVLALTATAAPPVREEIVERLGMGDPALVVAGFDRPDIRLEVRRFLEDGDKRRAVVERAAAEPKPGILYAGTRKGHHRTGPAHRSHRRLTGGHRLTGMLRRDKPAHAPAGLRGFPLRGLRSRGPHPLCCRRLISSVDSSITARSIHPIGWTSVTSGTLSGPARSPCSGATREHAGVLTRAGGRSRRGGGRPTPATVAHPTTARRQKTADPPVSRPARPVTVVAGLPHACRPVDASFVIRSGVFGRDLAWVPCPGAPAGRVRPVAGSSAPRAGPRETP